METATTTVATELLPSTTVTAKQLETEASRIANTTFRSDVISESSETRSLIEHTTETAMPTTVYKSVLANQIEKTCTVAWILFAMMSILFSGSLTINVIVLAFLIYKKRQVGEEKGQLSEFEIEGNPCYEATEMKQNSESEAHVYEIVREKRAK